jgi:uncharacterized damage-inducible protein DinB
MSIRTHFVMLAYYHRWATRRVLASVNGLVHPLSADNIPKSPIHPVFRPVNIPCSSIYGTLSHLHLGEKLWFARITGQPISDEMNALWSGETSNSSTWENKFIKDSRLPEYPAGLSDDGMSAEEVAYVKRALNSLSFSMDDMNSDWMDLMKGTEEKNLFIPVEYKDTDGTPRKRTRSTLYTHVFNHATHHRGQVSAALQQMGVPYPELDLTAFLPEWEELHSKAFRWA